MIRYLTLTFLMLTLTFPVLAQKKYAEIIGDSVKAKSQQKIGLGMHVMSEEDNKTVLLSKSGRYLVKGTVTDMWDGVQTSDHIVTPYPYIPEQIDPSKFYIEFGAPNGKEVMVYLSYGCRQCDTVIKQIFSEPFITQYRIKLLLVSNNKEDKLVNSNIHCATDKVAALKAIFVERDLTSIKTSCPSTQESLNIMLAMAQKVRALPSTFLKGSNKMYLGKLPESLL